MKRTAIIIGNNTGKDATNYLPGVTKDVMNYKKFLTSANGGKWDELIEIIVLHNENRQTIKNAIRQCSADYAFVVYSGHGYLDSKDNLTYICVEDGNLNENELRTSAGKQTLILDCCREIVITSASPGTSGNQYRNFAGGDQLVKANFDGNIVQGRAELNNYKGYERIMNEGVSPARIIYNPRGKFDNGIASASSGLFTAYACSVDQTSGDNPDAGGVYSSALIKTGIGFSAKNSRDPILRIEDAHQITKGVLKNELTTQIPDQKKLPSEMIRTAPFAVTNTNSE